MSSDAQRGFTSLQMTGIERVDAKVDANAAVQRLSKAITFRTISNQDRSDFDEGAFNAFHAFLEESFPKLHATLKREKLGDPRAFSLLYTWTGKDPSLTPVVLMGHQDVVPVVPGTEGQWEHDAYSGDIADGYVWGRGSLDDKVMILSIMEAVEMRVAEGFQPTRTTYLIFGQDEEVMGPEGARHVAKVLRDRGVTDIRLVVDEGLPMTVGLFPGVSGPIALVATAEKGYVTLELTVTGSGGHSAMPPSHSTIGILAAALVKVEDNRFPDRIGQAVRDQMRYLGPALPESSHAMLSAVASGGETAEGTPSSSTDPAYASTPSAGFGTSPDYEDQFFKYMLTNPQTTAMLHTTTAVTMISGGIKENVMPPSASAQVNYRIGEGDTVESVIAEVTRIIGDERVKVTAGEVSVDPSPTSDAYGKEYKAIEKTVRQTWDLPGLLVSPYLNIGGDDAKWLGRQSNSIYRITALHVESAADVARWHGVNERVLVSEVPNAITFYYQLLENVEEL